jgi:hypothetical protein
VKRKAIEILKSSDSKRAIYVDEQNAEGIHLYIQQDERHREKFRFITDIILGGHRNTEVYDKEKIDGKSKGVTAMKFFKGQENDRIYCREITKEDKTFVVIASELHKGKQKQKNTQKEKNIIHKVAGYEYELEE